MGLPKIVRDKLGIKASQLDSGSQGGQVNPAEGAGRRRAPRSAEEVLEALPRPFCLIYLKYSEGDEIFDYVTGLLRESIERGDRLFVDMTIMD